MRILVIDNYDSFVYNLVQYLGQLGADCDVRRNDALTVAEAGRSGADGILLSPGPSTPERAGICMPLVSALAGSVPILGVCLGHQAIGAAYGATVTQAPELLHGKTSTVTHSGAGVLSGLPNPFTATRYHSLAVVESTLPDEIEVTARTGSIMEFPGRVAGVSPPEVHDRPGSRGGVVMAMRHRTLRVEGVQFHPESVLTEAGHLLLANWLARCGMPEALERAPALAAEVEARRTAAFAHA
ncbi:MAG: aminodeoxychorismate/anthranilate synthase component II [Micromonosporaceae bacterium]|nr:aminodeoxychorismate/anthranilate synthase component II [Micromonosporaceae bacterium]